MRPAVRVLVVGGGGREHALAWKLSQSPKVTELFAAPGNPGIAALGSCVPIHHTDIVELGDFADSVHVDLTVVGPELPLTLGIVDEFERRGLRIFGPRQGAAELEGSKVFSKRFMETHGIPTAAFRIANSRAEAEAVLDAGELGWPVVLKADGLASGKGVLIPKDREEAEGALVQLFDERAFGGASDRIVIEECLTGVETSFHVLCDGQHFLPLASAQDYKRALDGDQGPNTGGMGTVSPSPRLSKELQAAILEEIVVPTVSGLREEGRPYKGVLFIGLMLTEDGPKVLEYNVRFGDPEAQVILPRLDGDLFDLLTAVAAGKLKQVQPKWHRQAAACVVLASEGYPAKATTGRVVTGLAEAGAIEGVTVFQAATRREGEAVKTVGGRVLGVTALAPNLQRAREVAYQAVDLISFEGAWCRRDIGADILAFLAGRKGEA